MLTADQIRSHIHQMRADGGNRDAEMREIQLVRQGRMDEVHPGLFSDEWPKPIVANFIDIAARDLAEVIAPLPSFNCAVGDRTSDKALKAADKRTRIVYGLLTESNVQIHAYTFADWYITYSAAPIMVELDFDAHLPRLRFDHPIGAYWERDRFGRVKNYARIISKPVRELMAEWPEHALKLKGNAFDDGSGNLEVWFWHDKDQTLLMVPQRDNLVLQAAKNPLGTPMVVIPERPGAEGGRGQFDDILWVQLAKARFALYGVEAAHKSVQAPTILPMDVQELSIGGDEVIRTNSPQGVRRLELPIPSGVFAEQQVLDNDLKVGSRYPEGRLGQIDGSIVTGKGVQALMGGFDTQVKAAQTVFAAALGEAASLLLKADQRVWPNRKRKIRGANNGTQFDIEYTPAKDIDGLFTVDVQYGLMAGLDPNRALIFGLQARGDKLISRDFLRRQMPWSMNVTEEEQRVDIEELRDALMQAVMGYAQSIPVLAQNGQDPGQVLSIMAEVIEGRQAGDTIEKTVSKAFAPEPVPATPPGGVPQEGGLPGEGQPGAGVPDGMQASGLLNGVAQGQAGAAPGGRPDLQVLLAGLSASGNPQMGGQVIRRKTI